MEKGNSQEALLHHQSQNNSIQVTQSWGTFYEMTTLLRLSIPSIFIRPKPLVMPGGVAHCIVEVFTDKVTLICAEQLSPGHVQGYGINSHRN